MIQGFKAAGAHAGIKKTDEKDLGVIFSVKLASVAAVFTRNKVQAAPVMIDRKRVKSGQCQAIIVNSGNANCCTGEQGMNDAFEMTRLVSSQLGIPETSVLVASTGVIGELLPMDEIKSSVPDLIGSLSDEGLSDFSKAIMTTDTVPKMVTRAGEVEGKQVTITGIAKGAGMIRPDMATLLCFVLTDLQADQAALGKMLKTSVDRSFNRITIDGDTSTNDTVLLLANGISGAQLSADSHYQTFQDILDEVLLSLAKMIVKDGEGATKLVEVSVCGATTDEDALRVAETVAHSSLVKTALFGEDANFGRILGAIGRSGAEVDPDHIDICFDDVMMAKNGQGCGIEAEHKVSQVLKQDEFNINIALHLGNGTASFWTCDFSIDYVKINADYRS